jgi:hypothetical protein
VSNTSGPDSWHFKRELTSKETDEWVTGKAKWLKDQQNAVEKKTRHIADFIGNEIPAAFVKSPNQLSDSDVDSTVELNGTAPFEGWAAAIRTFPAYIGWIVGSGRDWLEENIIKIQNGIIDLLGGEWLFTRKNFNLIQNLHAVATLIDVLEILATLAVGKDICEEGNLLRFIDLFNSRTSNVVAIVPSDSVQVSSVEQAGNPALGRPSGQAATSANSQPQATRVNFSLSGCMKAPSPSEESQLRRFIEELTR